MRLKAVVLFAACFLMQTVLDAGITPQSGSMTNKDVIELKQAGGGDDLIILRIRPDQFHDEYVRHRCIQICGSV